MDDATRAMNALLLSELPDPGLDLSFQQLHAFSLFAKLPLEVRLMIWRRGLPNGRGIWLTADGIHKKLNPKVPMRMRINRESRTETSRHCRVIYKIPSTTTTKSTPVLLFAFDKDADILMIDVLSLAQLWDNNWLRKLLHANTDKLEKVKTIDLRARSSFIKHFLHFLTDDEMKEVASHFPDLATILIESPARECLSYSDTTRLLASTFPEYFVHWQEEFGKAYGGHGRAVITQATREG